MDSAQVQKLTQRQFKQLIGNDKVCTCLSKVLLETQFKSESSFKISDMKECLKSIDKKLFLKVLSSSMTLDQLRTRVFELIQGKGKEDRYFCVDDMRELLGPDLFNYDPALVCQFIRMVHHKDAKDLTAEEATQPLKDWQSNQRCVRSIFRLGVKGPRYMKEKKSREVQRREHY